MLLHIEIDSDDFNPLSAVVLQRCVNVGKEGSSFFKQDVKKQAIFTLGTEEVVGGLKKIIGNLFEMEGTKINLSRYYNNHCQICDENYQYITGDKNFFPIHRIDRPMSDLILNISEYEDKNGVITFNLDDITNIDLKVCHHLLDSVVVNPVQNIDKNDLLQQLQDDFKFHL